MTYCYTTCVYTVARRDEMWVILITNTHIASLTGLLIRLVVDLTTHISPLAGLFAPFKV